MAPKWYEQKKQYREYRARVEALPPSSRDTVAALERYINHLGGMDDADSILTMMDDLVTLFEGAAADGTPVRDVVGADPVEFAEDFLSNYPAGSWIRKERDRLTRAVEAAEGDAADTGSSA